MFRFIIIRYLSQNDLANIQNSYNCKKATHKFHSDLSTTREPKNVDRWRGFGAFQLFWVCIQNSHTR